MRRTSTVAHYFVFPVDAVNISNVLITYSQRGVIILEKTEADMTVKDNVWSVVLTQRETRRFIANDYAYVQARLIGVNGASAPSDVVAFPVEGVLNDEYISPTVTECVTAESIGESQTFRMTFSEAIEMLDITDEEMATDSDIEDLFADVPEGDDVYATDGDIEDLFNDVPEPVEDDDEDVSDSASSESDSSGDDVGETVEDFFEDESLYATDDDILAMFAGI